MPGSTTQPALKRNATRRAGAITGKSLPAGPGHAGIFSLGAPGVLEQLLTESGFVDLEQRMLALSLRMPAATDALTMMQEAFGAYRAVVALRRSRSSCCVG